MPKVETSLQTTRGDGTIIKSSKNKCVSKTIGIKSCEYNSRIKRDVENTSESHRKRVVKKLVRVNPVDRDNSSSEISSAESDENSIEKLRVKLNRPRKRLVIKKKRKLLQPTKVVPRRKVIVTKKRLITTTEGSTEDNSTDYFVTDSTIESVTNDFIEENNTIPISTTEILAYTNTEEYDELTESPNNSEEEYDESVDLNKPTESFINILSVDSNNTQLSQNVPDYEPFFPELSEPLDAPILLLKTTVLSSVDLQTKTILQSRLRTYTFLITRVNGDEKFVTSTTEVKPHTKTIITTEPHTRYTTLTLLDLDSTETLPYIPQTVNPSMESSSQRNGAEEGRAYEEARYNLATRVMSNGVEVIVAGDKSTLPGEPDVLRVLPSSIYKPVTLKPSTLSDHMMMLVPQDASNIEFLSSSLYPHQFVTKTCLTTFTYLTTFLENGTTTISSHEQVVSNIATEARNTGKILPTPSMGITLTQYPNLAVGLFLTTYTYLNTILDGEQPLVVTSKHIVTNTVTAPDDYLSLLKPSDMALAIKDTNTYYSTIALQKTLKEGDETKVISTNEVITQVVITESVPPKATSVMTSYIAVEDPVPNSLSEYSTTDITKTYYVTYTYYDTVEENGKPVTKTSVSTSADIVTEKLFLHPKRTQPSKNIINTTPLHDKKNDDINLDAENLQILAAKTYLTTFTYFTTLLQEVDKKPSTVISSHSRVVQDIVTETLDLNLLDSKYLDELQKEIKHSKQPLTKQATLLNGNKIEITVLNSQIKPSKVQPIEKTKLPERSTESSSGITEFSKPNVITGSTIIFFDDDDLTDIATIKPTPSLSTEKPSISKSSIKNNIGSLLSSEIVKKTKNSVTVKGSSKLTSKSSKKQTITPTKPARISISTSNKVKGGSEPGKKQPSNKISPKPANTPVPDLLGLGSININSLQALTPVLNAMAGLIQTNLKPKKNESNTSTTTMRPRKPVVTEESDTSSSDSQNRSPIYIPVGGISDDIETAESQNIPSVFLNNPHWDKKPPIAIGKPTHESPLLNGGIPISPGEVITANSDVIVGKPGRVGPRKPSIAPSKDFEFDDVPVDMKPPPVPNKMWPKRHLDLPKPESHMKYEKPVIHTPNKDDYVGPPPAVQTVKIENKRKQVTNKQISRPAHKVPIPIGQGGYAYENNNIPSNGNVYDVQGAANDLHKNYAQNYVPYTPALPSPIEFNVQPSLLNEPIALPEVIERSTGQPLLVNIQPSQIAFVNIPHNRTTALIFGGSTEPHRNGQYFDDPSPYPEPDNYGSEYYYKNPHIASVFPDIQQSNQKRVGGVIKVGPQFVNMHSDSHAQFSNNGPLHISPTKPVGPNVNLFHQDVNVNVPPISFEMVHKGNDFNAHIINHGDIHVSPPSISFGSSNYSSESSHHMDLGPYKKWENNQQSNIKHQHINNNIPKNITQHRRPASSSNVSKPSSGFSHYGTQQHLNKKQKPSTYPPQLVQYMTPPSPSNSFGTTKFVFTTKVNPVTNRPRPEYTQKPIPLTPTNNFENINNLARPNVGSSLVVEEPTYDENDSDVDDSLENEAGELVQGSNARPLRPGEVPIEILRAKSTTPRSNPKKNETEHKQQNNKDPNLRPILSNPRPFEKGFAVRPENKQTNQINHHENNILVQSVSPNHSDPNAIYISYRPDPYAPAYTNSIYNGVFGVKTTTTRPTSRYTTTQRPFKSKPTTYHNVHKPTTSHTKIKRPAVTSLPINTFVEHKTQQAVGAISNSQTEKPFGGFQKAPESNNVVKVGAIEQFGEKSTMSDHPNNDTPELNIGEIPVDLKTNLNDTLAQTDMEVMKPPPMEIPMKEPDVEMQPPKLEVTPTPSDTQHIPNFINEHPVYLPDIHETFVQKPSQEMVPPVPPPKVSNQQDVLGMQPPRPATTSPEPLTEKPTFSLQIDVPKEKPTHTTTTQSTIKHIKRRPTRRPTHRYTTLKPSTFSGSTRKVVYKRPIPPRHGEVTTEKIITSSTTETEPNIEVFVRNPDHTTESKIIESSSPSQKIENTSPHVELVSSMPEVPNEIIHSTPVPIYEHDLTTSSKKDIISDVAHHTGNAIKIIDDTTKPNQVVSNSTMPTRYITHTKTTTITITKTSVVTTMGGPPSTLTILLTKTETITMVDTVTAFHTLIKPTSIVHTVYTTVKEDPSSLYSSDATYGTVYPVKPTAAAKEEDISPTVSTEDLSDFIISDTEKPSSDEKEEKPVDTENDTIFVVMTDKNHGSIIHVPKETKPNPNIGYETEHRDEMVSHNEANNVLLGGILIASQPNLEAPEAVAKDISNKCIPECRASKNELCMKVEGIMRCMCRPGFARMFPDHPCKPTYTYNLSIGLDRYGNQRILFDEDLNSVNSTRHTRLASATHDGLDRMIMQSDLRDSYHGVRVNSFKPSEGGKGVINNFYLQLSDSTDEKRLEDILRKYLRNNNYSLGGTELYASKESLSELQATDFDECTSPQYHDCSEYAHCFNLKGTYTCSCKEGYADLSENVLYPGRICSAEIIGCEKCHYHGTCYTRGDEQVLCECFQWYAGESCHINLKALLIALATLGIILLALLLVCVILTCCKKSSTSTSMANGMSFLPQRISQQHNRGTLEKRAMISDTSSESSQSNVNIPPYVAKTKKDQHRMEVESNSDQKQRKLKGALKKTSRIVDTDENDHSFTDQKDRSLTVMIPRAKYHPGPNNSSHNTSTFDKRKISVVSSNEAKLLSYLDAGPSPSKAEVSRKYSNAPSDSFLDCKLSSRKTSGALISAGFEVSATVLGNNLGTLGTIATTCGTEADRSENATLIQKISADLLSSTGTRSQFNTLRKSLVDEDVDPLENWLDITPRITTVSEARSYDETTIPPATKSFRNDYDSKPSSQHQNDEANTMAERDLGSTFLLPHTHLYKPDRGSDASGFESL